MIRAFAAARATQDVHAQVELALAMPSIQEFGVFPGQLPALIHEVYEAHPDPVTRCRLAAALARAWVYGGDADRGRPYSDEAVAAAEEIGVPEVLCEALDSALLTRWGPDQLTQRAGLAARLDSTAAHLTEVEARLSAHLWRLTTAWESLDVVGIQRQLRALDTLADETGDVRARFFAVSRRAMQALVVSELERADELIAETAALGEQAGEPDLLAVNHSLDSARALRAADLECLAREAALFEEFGAAQGIASITAQAAVLWQQSGQSDRAGTLLSGLAGSGLGWVPRDVDFILICTSLLEVAAAQGVTSTIEDCIALLEPYTGRPILNAGAVSFHGVVDDYLRLGYEALGEQEAATRSLQRALLEYTRLGADWWRDRLSSEAGPAAVARSMTLRLHRIENGCWAVGGVRSPSVLGDMKGLHYLRQLLGHPGRDIAATNLTDAVAGHPGDAPTEMGTGEVVDRKALAAYRSRLQELDGEIDEADSWADQARSTRLGLEREALLAEVSRVGGLAGRTRRFASNSERARVSVRKAIVSALDRTGAREPEVARLLRDCIHTGSTCRYEPDPARPVKWILDPLSR